MRDGRYRQYHRDREKLRYVIPVRAEHCSVAKSGQEKWKPVDHDRRLNQ